MTAPFGALAPSPFAQSIRQAAERLPDGFIGKRAASLLLRAAGGKSRRPFDVTVFDTERARLHPYDNISEKRVYITPQFWEAEERAALANLIAQGTGPFRFLDVGANAGLYTLFARAQARRAGRPFKAICVEPAAEMLARLRFNLAASTAESDVCVFDCAAGAREGASAFRTDERNRGESRLGAEGTRDVRVRPLAALIEEAGAARIDAMKIDVEGGEAAALKGLFDGAGERFRPRFIIAELAHSGPLAAALGVEGYRETIRTRRNGVFERG